MLKKDILDLMEKFEEHADKFGVKKFPMQEIKNITSENAKRLFF